MGKPVNYRESYGCIPVDHDGHGQGQDEDTNQSTETANGLKQLYILNEVAKLTIRQTNRLIDGQSDRLATG